MSSYQTLFDGKAREYAQYRPGYPAELFQFIIAKVKSFDLAWDAGTGSGQAAEELTRFFSAVVATDASASQIQFARQSPGITYRQTPSESSGLPDSSCDLITAANAVHWFDIPDFFSECRRVLKADGIVAVWCYSMVHARDAALEPVVQSLIDNVCPFWPEPIQLVFDRYRTIEFPFREIPAPEFTLSVDWTLQQFVGYSSTWSATKACKETTGKDPIHGWVESHQMQLDDSTVYTFEFPLHLRMGCN